MVNGVPVTAVLGSAPNFQTGRSVAVLASAQQRMRRTFRVGLKVDMTSYGRDCTSAYVYVLHVAVTQNDWHLLTC